MAVLDVQATLQFSKYYGQLIDINKRRIAHKARRSNFEHKEDGGEDSAI
jgi:hypothetical protein